ncbi:hypothetical protein SRABI26_02662 [Arthrobacter sp. Bi26]|nr:hypothetical protein SRABI26_02662 [Arthrobacter sp. Bi26]
MLCISQNSSAARPWLPGYSTESTGPTILQHLTKRGLLGYLRPRVTTPAPATIITTLGEKRMATLDKDDLEKIEGFAIAERKTTVLEVRANSVATVNAIGELIEDAVYKLSVFTQKTDNQNTNRSIDDFRAELRAGISAITAQHATEEEGGK